ncbi:MAG: membrane dipeptidase [Congregibacter sp.]
MFDEQAKSDSQLGSQRRMFLRTLASTAVGAAIPLQLIASKVDMPTPTEDSLERAQTLLREHPMVDFHTHIGLWQTMGLPESDAPLGQISRESFARNIRQYREVGCNCLYMDALSDIVRTRIGQPGNKDRDFQGDEAWEDYLRQRRIMQELLESEPIAMALSVDDIARINAAGKLAVIFSSEGAHMLERDPTRLEQMYRDGLRRLQPLHYVSSLLGDNQTDPVVYGGLSDLGKELLMRADELGILLDMAHATQAVVEQTAELVSKPLALSHTMVRYNSKRFGDYRNSRARWITPDHARMIAATGGVVGTFPIPAPYGVDSMAAFIEALKVMVDIVGIDHVAWSTDLVDAMRPVFLDDYANFTTLCALLLESGFGEEDVRKFVGGNALRVQQAAVA